MTKKLQDLYIEKYKTILRDIREDLKKCKAILCLWIRRLNIAKMAILLKLIYRLNVTLIKMPTAFFAEMDKLILKFTWKYKIS